MKRLMLMGLTILAAGALLRGDDIGRITRLIPNGVVVRHGFAYPLQEQLPLREKDVVRTKPNGRMRIVLNDGSILNVGSDTEVVLKGTGKSARLAGLEVPQGRISADFHPQSRSFEIRTATAVVGVLGTGILIEATPEMTHVINISKHAESQVKVISAKSNVSGEVVLMPGQGTVVHRGKPPIPPHHMPADETQSIEALTLAVNP